MIVSSLFNDFIEHRLSFDFFCAIYLFLIKTNYLVPDDFNWDPATKSFGEPTHRPEIKNSTVEFIAPSEYMVCVIFCPVRSFLI